MNCGLVLFWNKLWPVNGFFVRLRMNFLKYFLEDKFSPIFHRRLRITTLPHPFTVFPAHIPLHRPHNLNVWNRLQLQQLGKDENLKPRIAYDANLGYLPVLLACVASVSLRFRNKERGTRVKDRAKNGGSVWLLFNFSRYQNRKSPSTVSFCSETKRKRFLSRLRYSKLPNKR